MLCGFVHTPATVKTVKTFNLESGGAEAKIDERNLICLWINSMIFRMQGVDIFGA